MTEDAQRLQDLFAAAVELPPSQRAEMLARECAGDPRLLAEVESLLEADARLRGTTAQPIGSVLTQLIPALASQQSLTGLRVGAYELREEIGRGGMGTVYRAERVDGIVQQQVAIKFVRRELLDPLTLKRFQLERQLMATLKHPFIARLLDAAQLDDGTPYYVMEFVNGVPITDYCEREKLDARQRVLLVRKVCGAVAEAHRELIVHRDLKPANILIDADGNPKLLDFGIAKPLAAAGGEETGTAHRYFSPQYAAPEQLGGMPIGVACDVYALGLLLYELLAGCRPFDLTGLSAGQVERLITEVPPAAPSRARARNDNASIRARQLRGDLDGIVMRCLRKLPGDRYASVEQLEVELHSYLDGLPVRARGGHRWYRTQKFVLRNKLVVAAALLVSLSLITGVIAFAWQARIAGQRATELEQVAKFQADMLDQVDPIRAGQLLSKDIKAKFELALENAQVPAEERTAQVAAFDSYWQRINATDAARDLIDLAIVKPAVNALKTKFADQPLVRAALNQVLADRYAEWGLLDAALPLQEQALAIRRRELGEQHPDTLGSMDALGYLLTNQGKYADAEPILRSALDGRRRILGTANRDTLTTMTRLGELLRLFGKLDESSQLLRESLASSQAELGADDRETLIALNQLGTTLRLQGNLKEAEHFLRQSLEGRRRVFGPDDPLTLVTLASVGNVLRAEGKFAEAEPYYRERLEKSRLVNGAMHPETLKAINAMGALLGDEGKTAEEEQYVREALQKTLMILGPDHVDAVATESNFGLFLMSQKRFDEAEPYLRDVLERRRRIFGPQSRDALRSVIALATLQERRNRHAEVIELLAPIEALSRSTFTGGNIFHLSRLQLALGTARAQLGDFSTAQGNLADAAASNELDPGTNNGHRADCNAAFAILYARWDKAEPGKGYARKASESARKAHELDPQLPPIEVDGVEVK